MNDALLDRIAPVTAGLRRIRFWDAFAGIAIVGGVSGWLLRQQVEEGRVAGSTLALVLLGVVAGVAIIAALLCRLSYRDPRDVAKQIEEKFPTLDQRLLTALSQKDNELGYLQQRVIKEARDHSRTHRWADTVPSGKVIWSRLSGLGATLFLAVVLGMLAVAAPDPELTLGASSIEESFDVEIVPGNTEVERGTSLVVTARFGGWVPDEADLVCVAEDGSERRITMRQNLDDPVVGGFVSSVDQKFTYRVVTPDFESESYSVDVFEHPSLVRSDANLEYPQYTGLSEKRVEDTFRVSAVEGTQVTWICFLNKAVSSAELVSRDGSRIELVADDDMPGAVSAKLDLRETQRLKLELVDEAGRKNKYPPELIARVLPNKAPTLKLTAAGDTSVSPLEELPIAAEVRDDFGVAKVGLAYTFATQPPKEITLGENIPRGAKNAIDHMIEFEELKAEPDQLLSYHFWAEDFGPDGELRRTHSDMYFAEVRPFEEIFREGEPPPGGQSQQQQQQSQNGQQAEQLAELQKEIINATWRVIRDERGVKRSDRYVDNVSLIRDSQADALAQLDELASEIRDEQSLQYVDEARGQMQTAINELTTAADNSDTGPLHPAMAAEQGAYGGLLKLRAREFQIVRSQQQQSQGQPSASQQRRQQQIDELEIKQDENRYQTQQQAEETSEEEQQQREIRQVLNRLRELARRQEDLNKELAQLQSALEQADSEEEKEEIERQLKRLREQQQDLLRETDELNERMQSPENQEQMAEASERLEETRENVRQASDALQQNDASEALTAGRRAEREFEEMRDEFREKAAGQFNEAVREMRNDAQELDQRQQDLSEKLDEMNQPQDTTGLRGADDREEVEQELEGQRERLGELLEQMQETVEQAETAEPLLAQKLYDSFRRTHQRQTDRQLSEAAELLRRGFDPQARDVEDAAAEGIGQLREELEEAASSVLGDQTKALQRALSELERLERDLDSEIERNNPQSSQQGQQPGEPGEDQSEDQSEGRQSRDGQQSSQQQGQPADEQSGQGSQQSQQDPQQQDQQSQQQQGSGGQQGEPQQSESDAQDPQSQQPGEQQSGQESGQQPGQQSGQQQSQQSGSQQSQSQQQGEQSGQGQSETGQGETGQPRDPSQRQQGERAGQPSGQPNRSGGALSRYAAENPQAAPLTGDDFRDWSDGLRDVEELVEDPELRSQAARVRDRARDVRLEFRRHSKEPQWELVDKLIAEPLRELKRNVSEELLRRSADKHAPVPIDRDPVPAEYTDAVRKYYESLGSGR